MGQSRRDFLKNAGFAGMGALANNSDDVHYSWNAAPVLQEVRRVQTPVLEIGYEEHGDQNGFPIILLHGFPYDIRAWDGVAPPLAEAGYRVLVPYLRGYGPTVFLDPSASRMAEQAAIGQDVIDFADALGLQEFALAGFDWGNRAACITSILHPERDICCNYCTILTWQQLLDQLFLYRDRFGSLHTKLYLMQCWNLHF